MAKYRKFLVSLSPVLVALGTILEDGDVSANEAFALLGLVATALGVYGVRNKVEG